MPRTVLHCDFNNFYASVECLFHPEIRGKPVAVCGDAELRHGIVLAKNYIAKKYDVQTGDPLWLARQKCPDIELVPPHFDRYLDYSRIAQEIFSGYTDQVEPFSIDESWLDVTGSVGLLGDGGKIADEIRERIRFELGVTASVGVSFSKITAKLASEMKKPDATTLLPEEKFPEKAWPLPVSDLMYVGRATDAKLRRMGVRTIGELARTDVKLLERWFGKIGWMLWAFANGRDSTPVARAGEQPLIKSVGNSTTTPRDLVCEVDVKITLLALCESVSERLRDSGFVCSTVALGVRDSKLQAYERQMKLPEPVCTTQGIFRAAFRLFQRHHNLSEHPVRSLSVRGCGLRVRTDTQLSLFPDAAKAQREELLEDALDGLRRRYGHFSVQRGIMLTDPYLSDLDAKSDHVIHPTGFLKS